MVFGAEKILDFLWIGDLIDVLIRAASCPRRDKGVRLVDLADRICALTASESSKRIKENREPEVGAFVAQLTAARSHFHLGCPEDPSTLRSLLRFCAWKREPFTALEDWNLDVARWVSPVKCFRVLQ